MTARYGVFCNVAGLAGAAMRADVAADAANVWLRREASAAAVFFVSPHAWPSVVQRAS